jgi:hypothetical protein
MARDKSFAASRVMGMWEMLRETKSAFYVSPKSWGSTMCTKKDRARQPSIVML